MEQIISGATTTPKLSLYSLPSQASEPTGSESPPLRRASASVPFLWEEAPGKPRLTSAVMTEQDQEEEITYKSLGLPPRLVRFTNMPSPTTVLDGPDVGRSLSFRSPEVRRERGIGHFGSSRWGSFRKGRAFLGGSFDISSWGVIDEGENGVVSCGSRSGGHDQHCDMKAKFGNKNNNSNNVRRRGSFLSLSHPNNLLASIYESFKQVVPWRRKQEKQRKMGT